MSKVCSKCKLEKDLGDFYRNTRYKDNTASMCRNCSSEYYRKYNEKNTKRVCETSREWYASNKHRMAEAHRKWVQDNPGKVKAILAKRRAIKKEALCDCCTLAEMAAYYKSCPAGHHVDHIQALTKGGAHCLRNMQQIEAKLNHQKYTDNIIYLKYRG